MLVAVLPAMSVAVAVAVKVPTALLLPPVTVTVQGAASPESASLAVQVGVEDGFGDREQQLPHGRRVDAPVRGLRDLVAGFAR